MSMNCNSCDYDAVIIGGGIIGCSIARELSKYDLKIAVIEKLSDVSGGTSKANSGIVHAGYDCVPGTNKAKYNVWGSKLFPQLAKDLSFPYKNNGSLVVNFDKNQNDKIEKLYKNAIASGIDDVHIISGADARELDTNISKDVINALYAKTAGIISPYEAVIAFAENAYVNGVDFFFDETVVGIEKINKAQNDSNNPEKEGGSKEDNSQNNNFISGGNDVVSYKVTTESTVETNNNEAGCAKTRNAESTAETNNAESTSKAYIAKAVINAAGLHADDINNFVSKKKYKIIPRKGEYMLFDSITGDFISQTIFQLPGEKGKGILVAPTVDGNLFFGPSSDDTLDKEDFNTSIEKLNEIKKTALKSVKEDPKGMIITTFAGLRANVVTCDPGQCDEADTDAQITDFATDAQITDFATDAQTAQDKTREQSVDEQNVKTKSDLPEGMNTTGKAYPETEIDEINPITGIKNGQPDDFIIEEAFDCENFINLLNINSPGLTSAPAIAIDVADFVSKRLKADKKEKFISERKRPKPLRDFDAKQRNELIKEDASYSRVVCLCETVTEGDIKDAINRPLGAKTMDGIKFRTRAMMGACQGGFCRAKVLNILAEQTGKSPYEIIKNTKGSYMLRNDARDKTRR